MKFVFKRGAVVNREGTLLSLVQIPGEGVNYRECTYLIGFLNHPKVSIM